MTDTRLVRSINDLSFMTEGRSGGRAEDDDIGSAIPSESKCKYDADAIRDSFLKRIEWP